MKGFGKLHYHAQGEGVGEWVEGRGVGNGEGDPILAPANICNAETLSEKPRKAMKMHFLVRIFKQNLT